MNSGRAASIASWAILLESTCNGLVTSNGAVVEVTDEWLIGPLGPMLVVVVPVEVPLVWPLATWWLVVISFEDDEAVEEELPFDEVNEPDERLDDVWCWLAVIQPAPDDFELEFEFNWPLPPVVVVTELIELFVDDESTDDKSELDAGG